MRKLLSSIFREQNFMLFRLPNQLIADKADDRYSFGTRKLSPGLMVANGHLRELTSGTGMSCSIVTLNFVLMFFPFPSRWLAVLQSRIVRSRGAPLRTDFRNLLSTVKTICIVGPATRTPGSGRGASRHRITEYSVCPCVRPIEMRYYGPATRQAVRTGSQIFQNFLSFCFVFLL